MSTDTPIPTLTAIAGLVEALAKSRDEFKHLADSTSCLCDPAIGDPCECAGDGDDGDGNPTWDGCARCAARFHEREADVALAVFRTRLPMAKDAELRRVVARAVLDDLEDRRGIEQELQAVRGAYPDVYAEIETTIGRLALAALDAVMGKR